jgi:hypothetical protein
LDRCPSAVSWEICFESPLSWTWTNRSVDAAAVGDDLELAGSDAGVDADVVVVIVNAELGEVSVDVVVVGLEAVVVVAVDAAGHEGCS